MDKKRIYNAGNFYHFYIARFEVSLKYVILKYLKKNLICSRFYICVVFEDPVHFFVALSIELNRYVSE